MKSSIDLLVQKLAENGIIHSFDINEAKEIHKQEIIDAYDNGKYISSSKEFGGLKYYNETYEEK